MAADALATLWENYVNTMAADDLATFWENYANTMADWVARSSAAMVFHNER